MTLPNSVQEQLEWVAIRQPVWAANAVAIGLTTLQTTALATVLAAAQAAQTNALTKREEAKQATQQREISQDALMVMTRGMVAQIQGKAKLDDNDNVYAIAMIPPPGQGGGATVPNIPTNVGAEFLNNGELRLSWGRSGTGVFYSIWRKFSDELSYLQIGATASRNFTDDAAEGAPSVDYYIIAHRGNLQSDPSEPISVILPGYAAAA